MGTSDTDIIVQPAETFDYERLTPEARVVVKQKTGEIRDRTGNAARNIIEIGERLNDVKDQLGHGQFLKWVDAEFGWSNSAALKMMQVAAQFKSVNFTDLKIAPSALYLLAAPSTPEAVREEFVGKAKAGKSVTHKEVAGAVRKAKPKKKTRSTGQKSGRRQAAQSEKGSDTEKFTPGSGAPDIDELEAATRDAPAPNDPSQPWAEYNGLVGQICETLDEMKALLLGLPKRSGLFPAFAEWVDVKEQSEFFDSSVAILKKHIVTNWASATEAARLPGKRNFFYAGDPKSWRDRRAKA